MTEQELYALVEERLMETPGYNCAQTVVACMSDYFGLNSRAIKDAASPFGGGLSGIRVSVCGAVSGGLMVIGLMERGVCDAVGRELIGFIRSKYGDINCDKILDIDFSDQKQVDSEKGIKKKSICLPLVKDVCEWLALRYVG